MRSEWLAVAVSALALTGCNFAPTVVPQVCIIEEVRPVALGPAATSPDGCIHVDPRQMVELPHEVQVGILAHEMRHVDELRRGLNPSESAADWSAGCELGRRGLDVSPLVYHLAEHNVPGGRYPDTEKRVRDVMAGADFCETRP